MTNKKIKVTTGTLHDMAREFISVWHKAESGEVVENCIETLYFNDERALFKALTPKRRELLHYVYEHGQITILALSKQLARDYRNVYQDVKELSQIGLMLKDNESGKYSVPWDSIVTQIFFAKPRQKANRIYTHDKSKKTAGYHQ